MRLNLATLIQEFRNCERRLDALNQDGNADTDAFAVLDATVKNLYGRVIRSMKAVKIDRVYHTQSRVYYELRDNPDGSQYLYSTPCEMAELYMVMDETEAVESGSVEGDPVTANANADQSNEMVFFPESSLDQLIED